MDAIQKILGAGSVANSVRAIWGFSEDTEPENKGQYFMSRVKGNVTKKRTGMKYTISEKQLAKNIVPAVIVWGEEHENSANDLLEAERDKSRNSGAPKQVDKAAEFLKASLSNGPKKATEIFDEAQNLGISDAAVYRAKEKLAVINNRDKRTNRSIWTLDREKDVPEDVVI